MLDYAVGINDLFWQQAEDGDDATEQLRDRLKDMSDEEIDDLDLSVVDVAPS